MTLMHLVRRYATLVNSLKPSALVILFLLTTVGCGDRLSSLPEASLTPAGQTALTSGCAQDGGVRQERIESPTLGWEMQFEVYLPPCYEQQGEATYPVLYLIPGMGGSAASWNAVGAARTANQLIRAGEIPPLILVTPGNYSSDSHGLALVNDLVPYVDGHLRTQAGRRYRAVGGYSLGGVIASRMAFQFPDLFGSVGVFGAGVDRSAEGSFDAWIAATPPEKRPRVLIDCGDNDPEVVRAKYMAEILRKWEISYTLNVEPGEHSLAYWGSHLEMYLRWYAEIW